MKTAIASLSKTGLEIYFILLFDFPKGDELNDLNVTVNDTQ